MDHKIYFNKKNASEWRFNPSIHREKCDRLVRAQVLPVCDNSSSCPALLTYISSILGPEHENVLLISYTLTSRTISLEGGSGWGGGSGIHYSLKI